MLSPMATHDVNTYATLNFQTTLNHVCSLQSAKVKLQNHTLHDHQVREFQLSGRTNPDQTPIKPETYARSSVIQSKQYMYTRRREALPAAIGRANANQQQETRRYAASKPCLAFVGCGGMIHPAGADTASRA